MKSCIYTYMYCTHIISLSVTMDPIFAVCLCVLFSFFLFLFIFHVKNLPQGYCLLLSFAICCENAAKKSKRLRERQTAKERERQGERKQNKNCNFSITRWGGAFLLLFCLICYGCCLCKNETYRVHYLLCFVYMAPTKIKIRSRILLIYLIKKDPVCCFYYCYLYFYFFITYNKSAEFAVLHNWICYSVTVLFTFARCVCGETERERQRGKWEPKEYAINSIEIMIHMR